MEFLLSLNFFFKLSISIYTGLNDLSVTLCTRKINTKYVWEPNLLSLFGETGNTTLGIYHYTINAICNALHENAFQYLAKNENDSGYILKPVPGYCFRHFLTNFNKKIHTRQKSTI